MDWNRIERSSAFLVRNVFLPAVQLLIALGSAIVVTGRVVLQMYAQHAGLAVCNDGFSPTGMVSGNTPQAALTTHYNKNFIENLKARTVHLRLCTRLPMPAHAGQIFRNFMIVPLVANVTQATEGTV